MTVSAMARECANCGQTKRCRFTGRRWICCDKDGCWDKLFPRGDEAA